MTQHQEIVMSRDTEETPSTRWELPLSEHPRLELSMHFARLTVVPTERGESPYLEVVGRDASGMEVDVQAAGGTTHVEIGGSVFGDGWWGAKWWEKGFWDKGNKKKGQRARIVLHVPANARARIESSAAKVSIERLRGCELEVRTDAGQISLDDIDGRMRISTDAGKIEGRRLSGSFEVEADMGAVELDILALDAGKHRVSADMGSVRISLAKGLPVRIEAHTSMGASRVDFPSTKDASAVLSVEADLGSVRVHASAESWSETESTEGSSTKAEDARSVVPYRADERVGAAPDAEVTKLLAKVADGSVSPADAREILRAMGWA